MMNKKAQEGFVVVILIILMLLIFGVILLYGVSYQSGTSKDIVQGYDNGIMWHHAYLKNDHTTAYCFDDERFITILDESQRQNKEVIISYKKYVGRGFFCSTSEKFERVVVTDVQFSGDAE